MRWRQALRCIVRTPALLLIAGLPPGLAGALPPAQAAPCAEAPRAAEAHRDRLSAALRDGFGVQYWGSAYDAEGLAAAPHGLLIVEATRVGADRSADGREQLFTPAEIARISHEGRRPVIAYLNLAEIESYRHYHARTPREEQRWQGPTSASGERLAAYWRPEWHEVLRERVDELMRLGFDGLFLDDVLHYYTHAAGETQPTPGYDASDAPGDAPAHARAMMALVVDLAEHARRQRCDAIVVVNNGAFIGRDAGPDPATAESPGPFARYRSAISAILAESVFDTNNRQPTIDALREDFLDRGVQVMSIDFKTHFVGPGGESYRELVRRRAGKAGFAAYVADDEAFNRLYEPIRAPAIR
ncbi:endo alpha-1,4 polygalactosaminidase (plasmid) [Cereibacter azotoformans]|uniref:endo alpha-1,4 polygalactosaminidase n=1 Tax=Cereibacter azotoformans TaxID=43057 RepID=UPI003B211529